MPEGTNRALVQDAVRDLACQEFSGFKWVLARHDDTAHTHYHLCVMQQREDGTRLNLRKGDLQRLRQEFALKLRERGIEATATKRWHRFEHRRTEKFALRQLRKRYQEKSDKEHGKLPKVDVKRGQEISEAIERGVRPENPKQHDIDRANQRATIAFKKVIHDLEKQGRGDEAAEVYRFLQGTLEKDTRSVDQKLFDEKLRQQELQRLRGENGFSR